MPDDKTVLNLSEKRPAPVPLEIEARTPEARALLAAATKREEAKKASTVNAPVKKAPPKKKASPVVKKDTKRVLSCGKIRITDGGGQWTLLDLDKQTLYCRPMDRSGAISVEGDASGEDAVLEIDLSKISLFAGYIIEWDPIEEKTPVVKIRMVKE